MATTNLPPPPVPSSGRGKPRLNPSQEKALDLTRHVAITAAAGSGKTTVLVERFVRILEKRGFHPEQIVAITFTEEAAAQMRERIREAVEARRLEAETETPGQANPWTRAARFLSLAKITTIHGFCLSLLREYPLDAGLNPDFRLPGPGEQELLLDEMIDGALREFSQGSNADLAALLDYVGRFALRPTLREMIRRRNYLGRFSPGQWPLRALESIYRRETAVLLLRRPEWTRLRETLNRIPARLVRDTSSCARRCRRQIALFERRAAGLSEEEFIADFAESFSLRVSPSKAWKESGRYEDLKGAWDDLKRTIQRHPLRLAQVSPVQELHFRTAIDALARLYAQTLERFQAGKRERGVLDFEDLLDFARQLVKKPPVREALQRRYRFFLIDEFQDTNHVQWEILQPLIGPESNFFAVGDSKQSIYRFRDADVSIFEEVRRWIGERGRVLEMPENYRSLPELVRFNNRVFGGLFKKSLPYEAAHQEMQARRHHVGADEGRVETCFYDGDEISEPRLTAARILRLIDEEGRRPEEIAVLLRARTRLKEYERALSEAGLAFHTVGGVGFYEQQEVQDLLNAARFLLDPADEVALLGTLRSPFFNFSDEELFALSRLPGESLWEKLESAGLDEAAERPFHWGFALEALGEWRNAARTDTVYALLRRILRETGLAATLSESVRCRRSLSNIGKLLETAREFEMSERRGLGRFLRFIDALAESDSAEPEGAPTGQAEDRVRIYTIHGAKGLQFPVVLLPELGVPFSSAPSDRFLAETLRHDGQTFGFLGFGIRDPLDKYRELSHPVYGMLRKLDQYRRLAEEKRLLYVACTRAEDCLILLGRRTDAPSSALWLRDLGAERHQLDEPEMAALTEWCPGSGRIESEAAREKLGAASEFLIPDTEVAPAPTPPAWEKTTWTATEIAHWKNCPSQFLLSRMQGLGEDHPLLLEPYGGEAALVGTAVHDLFEKTPDLERAAAVGRRLDLWLDRLSVLLPETPRERLRDQLEGHVQGFIGSELHRRMTAATRVFREKTFNVRHGDVVINGVIDRLFQEADGGWVVVDFKTNAIPPERIPGKVADLGYDLQVEIYLWAVSRVLSTERLEGVLYFTHSGRAHGVPFGPEVSARCRQIVESLPLESATEPGFSPAEAQRRGDS